MTAPEPATWKVYAMRSTTKLVVASGGLALLLSAGAGTAAARGLVAQVKAMPAIQEYTPVIAQVANTCSQF